MNGFDNEKYKQLQKQAIYDRIKDFGKVYIEVGGKLYDDNHASRVLPGFEPDVKMQIFRELKNDIEIIFCINARDIITKKMRNDNSLLYSEEVLRLVELMKSEGFSVLGIVINFYEPHKSVLDFEEVCKSKNVKTYHSFFIENYPNDVDNIVSENGFGKDDYVKTTKKIILVSAPGANSGKLETCLSQLYNDKQKGINSCYAKYETFPVWNLSIDHPVNIAYEMATVDLKDKNQIDPFYKAVYGKDVVNYNRDIKAFPVLSKIMTKIAGQKVYDSPTSMGINCVGFAINDDEAVKNACYEEIKRRHEKHLKMFENKQLSTESLLISEKLLKKTERILDIKN